jgi:hypothetical protein
MLFFIFLYITRNRDKEGIKFFISNIDEDR